MGKTCSVLTVCTALETMAERSCHFGSVLWRRYPCGRVYFCDHPGAPETTWHGCAPHDVDDDQFLEEFSGRASCAWECILQHPGSTGFDISRSTRVCHRWSFLISTIFCCDFGAAISGCAPVSQAAGQQT